MSILTTNEKQLEDLQPVKQTYDMNLQDEKKITKISSRVYALDTLRGYCILLMIAWHYYFFLKVGTLGTDFYIFWFMNIVSIPGNPIFIIVMGASLVLSVDSREKRGHSFRDNLIHVIKRAVIFFLASQIIVISFFLYFGIMAFQILSLYPGWLTSLGIGAIICFFLKDLRKTFRLLIMIGIEIGIYMGFLPYFGIDYGIIVYMTYGTIIGDLILEARENQKINDFKKKMLGLGLALFIAGIPCEFLISQAYDLTVPNNNVLYDPFFMIYALGMFTLLFSILFWIQDGNENKKRIFQPITVFSSLSITIFIFHDVLRNNFFIPFGFGNLFTLYPFIIFLSCFYITLYLIGVVWSRSNYKYSLEWFIRKFS